MAGGLLQCHLDYACLSSHNLKLPVLSCHSVDRYQWALRWLALYLALSPSVKAAWNSSFNGDVSGTFQLRIVGPALPFPAPGYLNVSWVHIMHRKEFNRSVLASFSCVVLSACSKFSDIYYISFVYCQSLNMRRIIWWWRRRVQKPFNDTLTLPQTYTSSDTLNNTNIDVDICESGPGIYLASRWNQILSQRPSRLLGPPRSFSWLISQLASACLSARWHLICNSFGLVGRGAFKKAEILSRQKQRWM